MKNADKAWPMLPAIVLLLAACATGGMQAGTGAHLSAVECRDLTEIRNKAPVTHERNMSEMAALERAGYHPGWFNDDPYYPAISRPRSVRSISGTRPSAREHSPVE